MHSPPEQKSTFKVKKIHLEEVATPIREAITSYNQIVDNDSRGNNSPLGQNTLPFENNLINVDSD